MRRRHPAGLSRAAIDAAAPGKLEQPVRARADRGDVGIAVLTQPTADLRRPEQREGWDDEAATDPGGSRSDAASLEDDAPEPRLGRDARSRQPGDSGADDGEISPRAAG